jgi:hypothetical protein
MMNNDEFKECVRECTRECEDRECRTDVCYSTIVSHPSSKMGKAREGFALTGTFI